MDALDEFFSEWSEPEAWCERCNTYPAIHVVVQDDDHIDGMIITYTYIRDHDQQVFIPICRTCSRHYIESIGAPDFQFAQNPERHQIHFYTGDKQGNRLRNVLWVMANWLLNLLKIGRNRQTSQASQTTEHYSGTQR